MCESHDLLRHAGPTLTQGAWSRQTSHQPRRRFLVPLASLVGAARSPPLGLDAPSGVKDGGCAGDIANRFVSVSARQPAVYAGGRTEDDRRGPPGGAQRRDRENTRGLQPPLSLAASPRGVPLTQGHHSSLMRQKYVYKLFAASPSAGLRLRTEPVEVTGLSNHRRNVLKTLTIRLARGERKL